MVEDIKRILEKLRRMDIKELACYDVKLEDKALRNYIETYASSFCRTAKPMEMLTPWERMCYYKVSNKTGTDCDVALFTAVVNYLVFGLKEREWEINQYYDRYQLENPKVGWILRGDTMNSYATTVHGYIKNVWMQLPNNKASMVDKEIIRITSKRGNWGVNSKFEKNYWEDVILCNYDYFQNVLPYDGTKYIRLNHTIGNFIPVPFISEKGGQFNSPRGIGETNDFWDLALLAIYHYYHKDFCNKQYPSLALRWLLGDTANVKLCQDWLDSFKGASGEEKWDAFVEQNFLQAFVCGKEDGHYGIPKELWNGHFEGDVMPRKEQYIVFFKNASEMIEARGISIAEKVKKVLNGKNLTTLAEEMVCGNGNHKGLSKRT